MPEGAEKFLPGLPLALVPRRGANCRSIPGFRMGLRGPRGEGSPVRYHFLFAHPDDDVLAAGWMHDLAQTGHEVHATWVTDTATMGGREARQGEARAVVSLLGLHTAHFLDLPSLGLLTPLARDKVRGHVEEVAADVLVCIAFEGGHVDHDAVSLFVWLARGQRRMLEFPLYSASGLALRVNRFASGPYGAVPISKEGFRRKLWCHWIYRSQYPFMIPSALTLLLRRRVEPYREVPFSRDYTRPPHPGRLNVDRRLNRWMGCPFSRFREAALTLST